MILLVASGAGFIGSNFVLDWLAFCDEPVINFDKLTYADNLASLQVDARHVFVQGDLGGLPGIRPAGLLAVYAKTRAAQQWSTWWFHHERATRLSIAVGQLYELYKSQDEHLMFLHRLTIKPEVVVLDYSDGNEMPDSQAESIT